MGSERVSDSTSHLTGGGDSDVPTTHKAAYETLTECFEDVFPYYLSIGMTYEQFWHGNVYLVRAYRKADKLRKQRQNEAAWLQGAYIYDAILSAAPFFRFTFKGYSQPMPYTEKPYDLYGLESEVNEEEEEMKAREEMEMFREKVKAFVTGKRGDDRERDGQN